MRAYSALRELDETGKLEFEGLTLKREGTWKDLRPGDTYIGERNRGPILLTVDTVNEEKGWVVPQKVGGKVEYPYDLVEVRKVSFDIEEK